MKLDLRPLLAGEKLLTFDYELPFDNSSADSMSFLYGVSFPSPLKVSGDITNTAGYMRLKLSLTADYQTACARCLAPIADSFSLDLEKTVATKDMLGDLPEDKSEDYLIIEDGFLDIDEELRDQLELEFPSRFLCQDDCKGLCQRCGKNLNEGACDCPIHEPDPRLAPLQKILEQMKRENKK